MEATAKAGVSWSRPTFTHASPHVVDPVGDGFAGGVLGKVMHQCCLQHTLGCLSRPALWLCSCTSSVTVRMGRPASSDQPARPAPISPLSEWFRPAGVPHQGVVHAHFARPPPRFRAAHVHRAPVRPQQIFDNSCFALKVAFHANIRSLNRYL